MNIAVLNGPNLNLLGRREPEVYGTATLADVETRLARVAETMGVSLRCAQHNGEGQLIDAVHALVGWAHGIVINAGAYTHSSLALRDALVGVAIPYVEVHISNVYAREPARHHSMLAGDAIGALCGFGTYGYELALLGLVAALRARVVAA